MEAFMFKVTFKKDGKLITKKVNDNPDADYPILSCYLGDYWNGKIDNLIIDNLETGQSYDYDNILTLRRSNER
jgi:hypothetical protein